MDITKLVINEKLNICFYNYIYLNKSNCFYPSVLNKYWSSLAVEEYGSFGRKNAYIYDLKAFRPTNDENRRGDFKFSKTFRTGDILLYKIKNDVKYTKNTNNTLIVNYLIMKKENIYIFILKEKDL